MTINRLLLSLAICGAGAVSVSAQSVHLTSGIPGTPIVLAAQDGLSFDDDVPEVGQSFEFEGLVAPAPEAPAPEFDLGPVSPSDHMDIGTSLNDEQSVAPEPQSLPVSTGHDHSQQINGFSPVSSGISGISHVNDGPVMWGNAPHRRSGVAQILLRTECNAQALWQNYSAERAQECADMWACLNKHRGAGCGCSTCAPPAATFASRCKLNRYLKQSPPSCDSCDGLAKSSTGHSKVRTVTAPASSNPAITGAPQAQIHSLPPPPQTRRVAKPKYNTASTSYRIMY